MSTIHIHLHYDHTPTQELPAIADDGFTTRKRGLVQPPSAEGVPTPYQKSAQPQPVTYSQYEIDSVRKAVEFYQERSRHFEEQVAMLKDRPEKISELEKELADSKESHKELVDHLERVHGDYQRQATRLRSELDRLGYCNKALLIQRDEAIAAKDDIEKCSQECITDFDILNARIKEQGETLETVIADRDRQAAMIREIRAFNARFPERLKKAVNIFMRSHSVCRGSDGTRESISAQEVYDALNGEL